MTKPEADRTVEEAKADIRNANLDTERRLVIEDLMCKITKSVEEKQLWAVVEIFEFVHSFFDEPEDGWKTDNNEVSLAQWFSESARYWAEFKEV